MGDGSAPVPGIGLALSGGGFRATLFHVGSLWRLNELGWLPEIKRLTSVSGGSITAGVLGHRWNRLTFDNNVATNFVEEVAEPLRAFCKRNLDVPSGIIGILNPFKNINAVVASKYRKYLFGDATLQNLPDKPRLTIYATSLQSGASVRFSKRYLADYKVGHVDHPQIPLAIAVAASSAFPPVLSPAILDSKNYEWRRWDGSYLFDDLKYRERMYLTDGGVYDNLGLEVIWDRYETVLVSDAGAPMETTAKPPKQWLTQTVRVLGIISEQTRALRKRRLIQDYKNHVRKGTYWGIATQIDHYELPDAMSKDNDLTRSMQKIRTRLNKFSDEEQGQLINWGYALTDAAMRKYVLEVDPGPGVWPVPEFPL